jgi:hypothetical protein
MNHHNSYLDLSDTHVLEKSLKVALAALDGDRITCRPTSSWRVTSRTVSTSLMYSKLETQHREFRVEYWYIGHKFRIAIHGRDEVQDRYTSYGGKPPRRPAVVMIDELRRLDEPKINWSGPSLQAHIERLMAICEGAERNTKAIIAKGEQQGSIVGTVMLAAGADPADISKLKVQLPSPYWNGRHWVNTDQVDKFGPDVLETLNEALEHEYRDRLMETGPTAGITSQWWNVGSDKRPPRCHFNMSAILDTKPVVPNPMDALRLLAARGRPDTGLAA